MAHSGLAKWFMPNLRQDYLGTPVLKFRKSSPLSICTKTIPPSTTPDSHIHTRVAGMTPSFFCLQQGDKMFWSCQQIC